MLLTACEPEQNYYSKGWTSIFSDSGKSDIIVINISFFVIKQERL